MSSAADAPKALTRHLDRIEAALVAAIPPASELASAARYALGWDGDASPSARGKRIRPSLCLIAAECLGGTPGDALAGAVAIELAHNFSLVHDDIQDRDSERHGRPTIWMRYGEAQAINVGDFLYTRALGVLAESSGPPQRRIDAASALLTALGRMLHGQWSDIDFETATNVPESHYLVMVANKTGALIGASFQVGALLAGASAATAEALRDWGEELGIAFQVWDDYIGIWGDPAETGKSNASDIIRKKRTLPILMALNHENTARPVIQREYRREHPDADAVVRALESGGIGNAVVAEATRRADDAIAATANLPLPGSARDELAAVASYLVQRSR